MKLSICHLLSAALLTLPSHSALAGPRVVAPDVASLGSVCTGPVAGSELRISRLLTEILGLITAMVPVDVAVDVTPDMVITAERGIVTRAGGVRTVETGLTGIGSAGDLSPVCGDIIVIFARGTGEVGNVGVIVGPVFFDEIERRLDIGKTLVVQGVNYSASIAGFQEGGDAQGSRTM